jgi:hypothetical protein
MRRIDVLRNGPKPWAPQREALAIPVLESLANPAIAKENWQTRFEAFNAMIQSRVTRYPEGYQAECSREAIYEGCGE